MSRPWRDPRQRGWLCWAPGHADFGPTLIAWVVQLRDWACGTMTSARYEKLFQSEKVKVL